MSKLKKLNKKDREPFEWRSLFEGRRKWYTILPACLLAMGACWWGYEKLTLLPPAEASKCSVEKVAEYVGSERGLAAMSIEQREEYLRPPGSIIPRPQPTSSGGSSKRWSA